MTVGQGLSWQEWSLQDWISFLAVVSTFVTTPVGAFRGERRKGGKSATNLCACANRLCVCGRVEMAGFVLTRANG